MVNVYAVNYVVLSLGGDDEKSILRSEPRVRKVAAVSPEAARDYVESVAVKDERADSVHFIGAPSPLMRDIETIPVSTPIPVQPKPIVTKA